MKRVYIIPQLREVSMKEDLLAGLVVDSTVDPVDPGKANSKFLDVWDEEGEEE